MNARFKSMINELRESHPKLSDGELEKLVAELEANKPAVKVRRGFRKELKQNIFGKKGLRQMFFRPPVLAAAAAVVIAFVVGALALPGDGRSVLRSTSLRVGAFYSEDRIDELSRDQSESIAADRDAPDTGAFNPEGPAGVEGQTPPATKHEIPGDYLFGYADNGKVVPGGKEVKLQFGNLSLTVKDPEKARDDIAGLAKKLGGYVETAGEELVVIRVPRGAFAAAMTGIAGYGEVTDKSIETYDVTARYRDVDLRLKLANAARDRLYRLLEITKDVKERFNILKEIQRLTGQIEAAGRKLSGLDRLASFSKISVTLTPRVRESGAGGEEIPFAWIKDALEMKTEGKILRGGVKLELPAELALLEKEKFTRAESPSGVSLAVYTEANSPRGDADFWREAAAFHLRKRFADATRLDLGKFKAVLFRSGDADPFYLLLGVHADGDRLTVCKVLFPNKAQYDAEKASVEKTIAGMEVRR